MATVTSITVNEALEALAESYAPKTASETPNTYSGAEIREALQIGKEKFPIVMRPLIERGDVRVIKVRRMGIDGRNMMVTAYQFIPPRKKR